MVRANSLALVSEENGEFISHAVKTFAESRGLYYDLWHKDGPIWIVTDLDWSKSNIGRRVNKLELGVFREDDFLEIKILPGAYRIQQGQRKSIRPGLRQQMSQRIPFDDFLMAINRNGRNGANEALHPQLERAWDYVTHISIL